MNKITKVLFLDIDGVCNSARWARQGNNLYLGIDPSAAKLVKEIVKQTKCDVVLSSTWRMYPEARAVVKRDVCHFIDVTKNMQKGEKYGVVDRGYEVQEWLNKHPGVEQYAILDDGADFFPNQWLFKTTFENGLTLEIAKSVIHHLNAKPWY